MQDKKKGKVTFIVGDGINEPIEVEIATQEYDRMRRESIIRGAVASSAIEEGGVMDAETLQQLLDEDAKKHD